jgi:tetratricopeptide (TPR) repeat protein
LATLVLAWAVIACWLAGCASLHKKKIDAGLVSARQMSLRGLDAKRRGNLQEAESLFNRAIEDCPMDERIRYHYAETLWQAGEHERAVAQMEEAVQLSGGNVDLVVRLGEMYLARGDLRQAAIQAGKAIESNRQLAAAWALRGEVLRQMGRQEESLASFHRALSYQPRYPQVQLATAEIYRHQGRPGRALATLGALADSYPPEEIPPQVLFLQGLALKELRRYEAASEALTAAARQGPPSPELLYHRADCQWLAGDPANAQLTVQAALAQSQGPASEPLVAELMSLQRRLAASPKL